MQKCPLVSVILPTHNRGKYIKRSVESVWKQTYENIELIIIDDGSTDGTKEIISEISERDRRVISLANETNLGLVKSLNRGVNRAKGKYVARLDDDDSWSDERKLEKQVDFLEKNQDYVLTGGGVIKIDEERREIERFLLPEKDEEIRKVILLKNQFAHTTVLFRKDIFDKTGGYDEKFPCYEDWDLWLKMGKIGKFYNFQSFFVYYLDHEYTNPYYYRNYGIRRQIGLNIKLRKKYRDYYLGYKKAILLCYLSYFYSFLPFKNKIRLIILKIKAII